MSGVREADLPLAKEHGALQHRDVVRAVGLELAGKLLVQDMELAVRALVGGLDVAEHTGEDRLRERVVEVEHAVVLRKREGGGVGADGADVLAAPCRALVLADVVLCDFVQCGRELHADDFAERIVRGNEQDAALAGAEVDETEAAEILPDVGEQRVDEQAR